MDRRIDEIDRLHHCRRNAERRAAEATQAGQDPRAWQHQARLYAARAELAELDYRADRKGR